MESFLFVGNGNKQQDVGKAKRKTKRKTHLKPAGESGFDRFHPLGLLLLTATHSFVFGGLAKRTNIKSALCAALKFMFHSRFLSLTASVRQRKNLGENRMGAWFDVGLRVNCLSSLACDEMMFLMLLLLTTRLELFNDFFAPFWPKIKHKSAQNVASR